MTMIYEHDADRGFSIETDPPLNLIRVRLWGGLWDIPLIDRFADELDRASRVVEAATASPVKPMCFVDARAQQVQAQDVIGHFQAKLARFAEEHSRTAVVIERALHRLQANRAALANQRVFASSDEAMAWLMAPAETAA